MAKSRKVNPFSKIVWELLEYDPKLPKSKNWLVSTNRLGVRAFEQILKAADESWDAMCDAVKTGKVVSVTFELCTHVTECNDENGSVYLPYVKLYGGGMSYAIFIPCGTKGKVDSLTQQQWAGLGFIKTRRKFGVTYRNQRAADAIHEWIAGNEDVELITKEDMEDVKDKSYFANLFVIWEGVVYSVETGEICGLRDESICIFGKRGKRDAMIVNIPRESLTSSIHLVYNDIEAANFTEFEDGLILQSGKIRCTMIGLRELRMLDELYRAGLSKLPDNVYDSILEHSNYEEEDIQNTEGPSNLKRIGDYPAQHKVLSQRKVRTQSEVQLFLNESKCQCVASWKLDGCAVRLFYRDGHLVKAVTKGKARDVTKHMENIGTVPKTIPEGYVEQGLDLWVTGELVAVNGRRAIPAGYLARKDADDDDSRDLAQGLRFYAYDSNIHEVIGEDMRLYTTMLSRLRYFGFNVVGAINVDDAKRIVDGNIGLQAPASIDTDGIVIRQNELLKYYEAGETNHHPRGSVAFKFEDVWHRVIIRRIYAKRGENNVMKIIADFDPIEIDGKKVKSAFFQPAMYKFVYEPSSVRGEYDVYLPRRRRFDYNDYTDERGESFKDKFVDRTKVAEVCLRGKVIPMLRLNFENGN